MESRKEIGALSAVPLCQINHESFNDHLLKVKQVTKKSSPSMPVIIVIVVIILPITVMVLVNMLVSIVALDLGYLIYLTSI
jgi:hypothetical protein